MFIEKDPADLLCKIRGIYLLSSVINWFWKLINIIDLISLIKIKY